MLILTLAMIVMAIVAVARGVDVRLSLGVAGLGLASLAGEPLAFVPTFLSTFSNEKFVVPICTAMGFAYALRHTGCDQHLVQLLTKPLRHVRPLLVPGVILVGFLVNIPVISQTSTAVCIGPVLVPLMRAAGLPALTIGAALLLGASIGGELLNPGAPELQTVSKATGVPSQELVGGVARLVFPHLLVATLVFWVMSWRAGRGEPTAEAPPAFRVNLLRAAVPLIPVVLLFTAGPPLNLVPPDVDQWMQSQLTTPKEDVGTYKTRLIGLAMLIGTLAAVAANPRAGAGVPKAFFEGAGYAFTNIISLIVIANCFA